MSQFVELTRAAEIPDPGRQLFEVGDRLVVVVHLGGAFYCLDDVCTHDGGPLSEGELCEEGSGERTIACPRHGAKFDLRTGAALTMPATQPTAAHEVKVEEGVVYVRLNSD